MCVQGKRGPQGEQENLGQDEGQPGAPFFSFISEVTGRALSKVVKSICSREGGKEKRLVARGKEHKGKIVHWEHFSPGCGVARLV